MTRSAFPAAVVLFILGLSVTSNALKSGLGIGLMGDPGSCLSMPLMRFVNHMVAGRAPAADIAAGPAGFILN